jgi:F-type H+-transporting ATPase subunit b
MKINWFTVIAEVINFLILVWLLRRFLYKPVLKAIDEREKKIASQLKDAKAKETEAKKEQDEFARKNETFDKEKKKLMDKAIAETNEERQKLFEAARNEATELRSKLNESLKEMQENLNRDIAQKTQQEVFAIARKALTDLASIGLEEQSVNIFIKRLNDLKKEEKQQFIEAFKSGSNPILLQSAFDLPEKQQTEIKSAVNEVLGAKTQFKFNTAPELISGIELTSNGYKLAWSISEYINSLQKNILETLNNKTMKDVTKKVAETPNVAPKAKSNHKA